MIPPQDSETARVLTPPPDVVPGAAIVDPAGRVLVPGYAQLGVLRPGLHRLSTGLIAYGVIGIVVTLLGLIALLWVGDRIGDLSDRAADRIEQVADTLDATSQALNDASDTAKTFATTLTTTVSAVDAVGSRVSELQPTLADLEAQFRSIDILGAQPLSGAADVVGSIHASLDGIDSQLDAVADSLRNGHDRLAANGSSLATLGSKIGALSEDMRSIEESVSDVQAIVIVTMLVLATWAAVPAIGALVLGLWLRRTVVLAA